MDATVTAIVDSIYPLGQGLATLLALSAGHARQELSSRKLEIDDERKKISLKGERFQ